jgi:hypothetical protein
VPPTCREQGELDTEAALHHQEAELKLELQRRLIDCEDELSRQQREAALAQQELAQQVQKAVQEGGCRSAAGRRAPRCCLLQQRGRRWPAPA